MEVAAQDGPDDQDDPAWDHRDQVAPVHQEVSHAVALLVLLRPPPLLPVAAGADAVVLERLAVVAAAAVELAGLSVPVPFPPAFGRDPLVSEPAWSRALV